MIRASIFIDDEYDPEIDTPVEAVVSKSTDTEDENPYTIHIRVPHGPGRQANCPDLTIHLGKATADKLFRELGEVLS